MTQNHAYSERREGRDLTKACLPVNNVRECGVCHSTVVSGPNEMLAHLCSNCRALRVERLMAARWGKRA